MPQAERARQVELFRVGLIFRPRPIEGRQLETGSVDAEDLRELVERHLEAARIGNLRHQSDIGERDGVAIRIGAGRDQRLDGFEALEHPMMVPRIDRALLLAELMFQIAQR